MWNQFEGKNSGIRGVSQAIGVDRTGKMSISMRLVRAHNIDKYSHVSLYYEETNKSIGLKPTNAPSFKDYKLTKLLKNGTLTAVVVGCSAFVKFYKIERPSVYIAEWSVKEEMLIGKTK